MYTTDALSRASLKDSLTECDDKFVDEVERYYINAVENLPVTDRVFEEIKISTQADIALSLVAEYCKRDSRATKNRPV